MNVVDLVVIGVAGLAAYRGWRRGFLGQVLELGGGFVGLVIGVSLGPSVADALTSEPGLSAALISIFFVLLAVSLGQTAGFLVAHRFSGVVERARLGHLDSGLGSGFGVVVWLLSFWLIGSLLVSGPSMSLAKALRHSAVLRATNGVMPEPPNVLAYLRQYLDTSGFPQVFAGLPRLTEPVDLPSGRAPRRAIEAGRASTVRVVLEACGGIQLGSGWVIDPDSVVTNAHVVAGGRDVTIQQLNGSDLRGRVVLFDPETDIAIVHVSGTLDGLPLPLEDTIQERGTPGATLGYPGDAGGEFDPQPAAVQASYEATGRDIYGRRLVTRMVYELRSSVRQGDSGGPFVLPDGRVAGVVFAASTTDDAVGYALTGAEVSDEIDRGSPRSEPVSTGNCTR